MDAVRKVFAYSNAAVAYNADIEVAVVPAGWHAVITAIYLKATTAEFAIRTGTTAVVDHDYSGISMAGPVLWVGAAGDDVKIVGTGGSGSDGIVLVTGVVVPPSELSNITS